MVESFVLFFSFPIIYKRGLALQGLSHSFKCIEINIFISLALFFTLDNPPTSELRTGESSYNAFGIGSLHRMNAT